MCRTASSTSTMERLLLKARYLFVYGFCPQKTHNSLVCLLTDGLMSHLCRFTRTDLTYQVALSHPDITRELSGLSFGPINATIDFAFVPSSRNSNFAPLLSIGGMPLWGLMEKAGCSIFLLACEEIADINQLTDGDLKVTAMFSQLVPTAMFVKAVYKQHCWHARHRFANLIIDDPLLKESYGYLNYRRLLRRMEHTRFSATLAFIPWNYKRTQRTVADLFRQRSDRLSICVHGCDHNGAEFASADLGQLNAKIQLATHRMKLHETSTGLPHCEVMVFPQGQFSAQSLRALKANNYLAAVNARVTPTEVENKRDVRVADCLDLAVTKYGFPLLLRRYPVVRSFRGRRTGTIEEFACDLFFGRPALVAEHHEFCKNDANSVLEFVNRLNSLSGELEWTGLKNVVARTYLERDISDQLRACRIYTNYQILENDSDRAMNYIIRKAENGDVPIESVLIDGKVTRFTIDNNHLRLFVRIPARASVTVQIVYRNSLPSAGVHGGLIAASRLLTRRLLSELRDNIICKNHVLLAGTNAARKQFVEWRGRLRRFKRKAEKFSSR
jgi:hypothetical protein